MSAQRPAGLPPKHDVPKPTRILIIARRDVLVDGITRIMESSADDIQVTCIAPGEPCTCYFSDESPDFLLLQEKSKPEPFEDFVREIIGGFPNLPLLVFGQSMSDDYLCRVIQAGARGYINEKMNGKHMIQALKVVSEGGYWIERHIMERFIANRSLIDGYHSKVQLMGERLTCRENEILELIMMGLSTSEIAARVFLSHQGVKAHLTRLYRKFDARNRSQLILRALDEASPVESVTGLMQQCLQAART